MVEARPKNWFAIICFVLALGTAALYWPITSHPFILYDDEEYITLNHHVTTGLSETNFVWAFTNDEAANWHPLTWLSHQLDCTLFGLKAGGHHFVNLLFHVANTLLLFVFLRRATGALWRSAFVAALFAWHPLHVESVAWAAERKDVLSTSFWLLTLLAWLRYVPQRAEPGVTGIASSRGPRIFAYVLALIFFALGLMSKPMVVTLPFVLLLLDFWPFNRLGDGNWRPTNLFSLVLEKIPFFALAAADSAITYLVQAGGGAVWHTPWSERLANVAIAYARYVIKLFWPDNLAIVYSQPRHWPLSLAVISIILLLLWTIPILLYWRRRPYLFVGWFWFVGTLVPTIGIVQVGAQAMADRYAYIPSIGFFILVAWGWADFLATRPQWRKISGILAGGILAGCVLATAIEISHWRSSKILFLHAIEVSPDNYVAANCLGKAFEEEGDQARALVMYRNSVELEPRYSLSQFNYAMSLLAFGHAQDALDHLEQAAAMAPDNPDIQYDLGIFFEQHNNFTNAFTCFSSAIGLRPDSAVEQLGLAHTLANLGQLPAAAAHYREALRLNPDSTDAKTEFAQFLASHPELR